MKLKNIFPFLSLLFLVGCDVTELPYGSVTDEELETNPDAVNSITLGTYAKLKNGDLPFYMHRCTEYMSDNVALSGTTTSGLMYIYNFQRIANNGYLNDHWGLIYKSIINCNNAIAKAKEGISPELDHVIGENYFLRGWFYFLLSNFYGRQYSIAKDSDLGVPMKLTADPLDYPERTPVKEMYKQIVADLQKAESLMNSSNVTKSSLYANVWAVRGMLSRVFLYMHDYENAIKYASDVITNAPMKLLSTQEYSIMNELAPEQNYEALFQSKNPKELYKPSSDDAGFMYAVIDGKGYGEMYASQSLLDVLHSYSTDVRQNFIKPAYVKTGGDEFIFIDHDYLFDAQGNPDPLKRKYYRFNDVVMIDGKYQILNPEKNNVLDFKTNNLIEEDGHYFVEYRQKRKVNSEWIYSNYMKREVKIQRKMEKRNDYPKYYHYKISYQEKQSHLHSPIHIRLGEVYLNRAEAYAALGNVPQAVNDLNVIRDRAGIPLINSEIKVNDIMDSVLVERQKELFLEGHRFYDLMRNNRVLIRTYPGTHDKGNPQTVVQYVRATDNCAIQFIPQRELDAYPIKLPQND